MLYLLESVVNSYHVSSFYAHSYLLSSLLEQITLEEPQLTLESYMRYRDVKTHRLRL